MLSLHAPKGSKCPCGKRATSTLMSKDGKRELLPCCTKCGLVFMWFKSALDADDATADAPISPELQKWFATDAGTSSMTIASVLVPDLRQAALARLNGRPDIPHDPDDFGRCYRLLKLVPGGAERMGEVVKEHPAWVGMAAAWPELTALYELEVPNHRGAAPKLYARMKQIRGARA